MEGPLYGNDQKRQKGDLMKSSTQDKAEGTMKDVKGKVKEGLGNATDDPNLTDKALADQAEGKVQKQTGEVKKVFNR